MRPAEEVAQAEQLLTVEQLAELCQVPRGTVYGWRYKHAGPRSIKVGRHVRFRLSDIEAWLDRNTRVPHA